MAFKVNLLVKIFGGQKCLTVSDSYMFCTFNIIVSPPPSFLFNCYMFLVLYFGGKKLL